MNRPRQHHQKPVTIVSLAKYPEIFLGLSENVTNYAYGHCRVLVRDGLLIEEAPGWKLVEGPEDFNFSKNVNLGLTNVDPAHDIFFISDDVRFTHKNSIEELQRLAYTDSSIGMISPKVLGPADNPLQTDIQKGISLAYSDRYLVFVCMYIKRDVLTNVGLMDGETFGGYGWDDVDYSRRVKAAGYKLAVTPNVEVVHGVTKKGTETFLKTEKGKWSRLEKQNEHNGKMYFQKWGDNKKEGW